ncbi:alpha/beta hydrolase [Blastopirellula marina]|uniref:Alpha/beta hydrolase n=1 Tax=Blastopirellula marina TaxID=124 RepID=A0A2S8F6E5_9BACT|nr:alpha/beta hydrolase [Blastopirellula marina]PQO27726.1 alpha/beta hydrolase [Blastopirellula marina]PTL41465.1 alpha/beta hydrolase [Blastopirellula marina]
MPAPTLVRCLLLFLLTNLLPSAQAAEPRVTKDLEYANVDGQSLKLDLYRPEADGGPLVVWIHGGGWQGGSKNSCPIQWLTEQGFSVASISYRFTDKAIFPAQIHDCKGAIRWLRAHRGEYGYSTDKIAVAGSSAGGHLAALLGTSGDVKELEGTVGGNLDQSSRVDCVADYYGATDFVLRSKTQPQRANQKGSTVYKLLGGGADQMVEQAKLASAVFHVTPDDPPFLVLHGEKDNTVLLDQSERMKEVYDEAKLPLKLIVIPNAGHGGKVFYSGQNRQALEAFLKKHLQPQP